MKICRLGVSDASLTSCCYQQLFSLIFKFHQLKIEVDTEKLVLLLLLFIYVLLVCKNKPFTY